MSLGKVAKRGGSTGQSASAAEELPAVVAILRICREAREKSASETTGSAEADELAPTRRLPNEGFSRIRRLRSRLS